MQLLDHVSISVPDIDLARPFYDAIMAALGAARSMTGRPRSATANAAVRTTPHRRFWRSIWIPLKSARASGTGVSKAASREQVEAFFEAGLATGGQSDGEPGLRPQYHGDYYGAFLVDPAGNRVEAVCHASVPASAS